MSIGVWERDFESGKNNNFDFKLDMLRKATFFHLFLNLLNPGEPGKLFSSMNQNLFSSQVTSSSTAQQYLG